MSGHAGAIDGARLASWGTVSCSGLPALEREVCREGHRRRTHRPVPVHPAGDLGVAAGEFTLASDPVQMTRSSRRGRASSSSTIRGVVVPRSVSGVGDAVHRWPVRAPRHAAAEFVVATWSIARTQVVPVPASPSYGALPRCCALRCRGAPRRSGRHRALPATPAQLSSASPWSMWGDTEGDSAVDRLRGYRRNRCACCCSADRGGP